MFKTKRGLEIEIKEYFIDEMEAMGEMQLAEEAKEDGNMYLMTLDALLVNGKPAFKDVKDLKHNLTGKELKTLMSMILADNGLGGDEKN